MKSKTLITLNPDRIKSSVLAGTGIAKELEVILKCCEILVSLPPGSSRVRVIKYLFDRFPEV